MSKISTLYDEIQSLCATTLTGYNEIPFPYVLDRNPIPLLDKAYGLIIGAAQKAPEDDVLGCQVRLLKRNFSIALLNQASYVQNDTSGVEAGIKAILEDKVSLYKAMEGPSALASAIQTDYVGDSGVDFGRVNGGTFAAIIVDFTVLYQESLV